MAAMTLMKPLCNGLGRPLLSKAFAPGLFNVSKQALSRSPVAAARIYGPDKTQVEGGPSNTGHWKIERVVSVALIPLIPAAIAYPCPPLDMALSAVLVLHTHWGLQGVFADYVHGQILPKILKVTTLLFSILAFGGLTYLNFQDVGFGQAVSLLYSEL